MAGNSSDVLTLADLYFAGTIDDQQLERLTELLRRDEEARDVFLEMADVHACLSSDETIWNALNAPMRSEPAAVAESSSRRMVMTYSGWATAAAILICVGLVTVLRRDDASSGKQVDAAVAAFDALITQQIDAQWQDGDSIRNVGDKISRSDGWVRIESGIVGLEFISGAQIALAGPAELRVDSEMECFLQSGKLTVQAPDEAIRFTVEAPTGKVIDLGTEFGVIVDESGRMDVHVLDGEVQVVTGAGDLAETKRLVENESVAVDAGLKVLTTTKFDQQLFDEIRQKTLRDKRMVKLQFDCGSRAGLYQGSESPANSAGEMASHDVYWNTIVGDQSGQFVLADGSLSAFSLDIDYGLSKDGEIDWYATPDLHRGTKAGSRGVFATALGEDYIKGHSRALAFRIRGLPEGTYRVYLIGRSAIDQRNWGNFLVTKAFKTAIGVNLDSLPKETRRLSPLDDPNANTWVEGQTHSTAEVEITNRAEYLTVMTRIDRDASPEPKGGGSTMIGWQIVQTDKN